MHTSETEYTRTRTHKPCHPQARRDARGVSAGDAGQKKALKRAEDQLAAAEVRAETPD